MDDVLVFGKDQKEHDKRLQAGLERMKEARARRHYGTISIEHPVQFLLFYSKNCGTTYSLPFSYKISIPAESILVKSIELEVGAQTDKTAHVYSYKLPERLTTSISLYEKCTFTWN